LSGLESALYALISPKRASSGAWGTTSGGKLVIVVDAIWFAMFCNREMGEDENEDEDEGDVVR
jgi:hypothetical protein